MLARHIAKTCTFVAEPVATSQNLGHSDVLTTLRSYGQISRERQRALVMGDSEADILVVGHFEILAFMNDWTHCSRIN